MSDNRDGQKLRPSLAEHLAKGEKVLGGLEADVEERTRASFVRAQSSAASSLAPQPRGEKAASVPSAEAEPELERRMRSMVAQALSTMRGPGIVCFIPKDRRPKYLSYTILPEYEVNEYQTVLVFQFATTNVEVRGRNLGVLAMGASFGRVETVRIADGDFITSEPYVTDIFFHPPEPGRLTWSDKGEYVPQTEE